MPFWWQACSSSSSVGATVRCGLWPVEQYLSVCPYLSPTLSVFSLPALEDFFPLLLSILSWVFLFVSSLPFLEWKSFWVPYPPPFSPRDPANLSFAPFIHFTIFSPLFNSSCSRFVLIFHSPSSYLRPYILLNIFLSKISRVFSSFFVIGGKKPLCTKPIGWLYYKRLLWKHLTCLEP